MKLARLITLTLFAVSSAAFSADEPKPATRPPGVEESNWIPITETYGLVITKDARPHTVVTGLDGVRREYPVKPKSVMGYYVIRRDGNWCRIEIEPNPARPMPLMNR